MLPIAISEVDQIWKQPCVCVCVCVRVLCVPQASSKNIDIPSSPLVSPAPLAQELEPSTMVLSVRGKKNLRLEGTL